MSDALPPRCLLLDYDLMMDAGRSDARLWNERLRKHRDFVMLVYELSAGGPPVHQLIEAIETGRLNAEAVAHFLYGMPFDSWTASPPDGAGGPEGHEKCGGRQTDATSPGSE